jgi:hypothetical protein
MQTPTQVPHIGFYRHYKHNPDTSINNYTYEVIGTGLNTENIEESFVVYRPLYEDSSAYQAGKLFWIRPLEMWNEDVTKDGKTFPRFSPITDAAVLAQIKEIKARMYPEQA